MYNENLEKAEEFRKDIEKLENLIFKEMKKDAFKRMSRMDFEMGKTVFELLDGYSELVAAQTRELAEINNKIDRLLAKTK